MSQKRVAVVLTTLVGTLTASAGLLLVMEGTPAIGTSPSMMAGQANIASLLETETRLQRGSWDYIIVYESGDAAADPASLIEGRWKGGPELANAATRSRGNFHFVVDGQRGTDGELKVGSAWLHQEPGAPYAGWQDSRYYSYPAYKNAVGVCLIGDLNQTPAGDGQLRTLKQLTHELQQRLNIPANKVVFQWELEPNASRATPAQRAFADNFRRGLE